LVAVLESLSMARCTLVALSIVLLVGFAGARTRDVQARVTGPPPGLTPYGRAVWNLDALLHDTFGNRQVWENPTPGARQIPNFSTRFIDLATSTPYVYTFAAARHSEFRVARPKKPPRVGVSATGENVPLKIEGAYVSCGGGKWLYGRNGQPLLSGNIWCSRTPLAP
jgi:hypothetical protein